MAQGLKFLWNVINLLQFLVFMQKWSIKIPPQTMIWLQVLRSITLYEFVPTKEIMNKASNWLGIEEVSSMSEGPLEVQTGRQALVQNNNIL